jgi:hypothetical protein
MFRIFFITVHSKGYADTLKTSSVALDRRGLGRINGHTGEVWFSCQCLTTGTDSNVY